jgi:RB1-inducible coiled-coil protein 1
MIYTEGNSLFHFLHSNSVIPLGLSPSLVPRKQYTTAEVVDKEYCMARKSENRFKVPQGTKFYRVKCKAIAKESSPNSSTVLTTNSNGNGTEEQQSV